MNIFKKPMLWLIVAVIYAWLFSVSTFIAAIGPPLIIAKITNTHNSISVSDMTKAFLKYAQEGATELKVQYNYFLFSLILHVLLFIPTLIIGIFVLRKKMWARNSLIALLSIFLIFPFALAIITSEFTIDTFNLSRLPFLAFILLLTRKEIKSVFT